MPAAYVVGDEPIPGYRLLGFLGRGGFGEVWKASAPGGAHVALKIIELHGKRGAKEFRALQLVKNIRHPNLVQVTAFWMKNAQGEILDEAVADAVTVADVETPVDVKETIDIEAADQARTFPSELIIAMGLGDKSLADRLTECQQRGLEGIPGHELLDYMEQAARAIDFLNSPRHDLGAGPVAIQHRDIKPQNILIVGDAVQVCDFGLARALSDITMTQFAGSPAYSAPECLDGNRASSTTDQYSLAISYVELRTGVLPFDDESLMSVINAHLQGKLNLSRLPEAERRVIEKATSLDPERRFASAREMVRALHAALEETVDETLDGPVGLQQAPSGSTPSGDVASSSILITAPHLDSDDQTLESRDTADDQLGRATVTDAFGRQTAEATLGAAGQRDPTGTMTPAATGADGASRRRTNLKAVAGGVAALSLIAMLVLYGWRVGRVSDGTVDRNRGGETETQHAVEVSGSTSVDVAMPVEPPQRLAWAQQRLDEARTLLDERPREAMSQAEAVLTAIGELDVTEAGALTRLEAIRQEAHLTRARAALRADDLPAVRRELEALRRSYREPMRDTPLVAAVELLADLDDSAASRDQRPETWPHLYQRISGLMTTMPEVWERDELQRAKARLVEQMIQRAEMLLESGDPTAARSLLTAIEDDGESRIPVTLLLAEIDLTDGQWAMVFERLAALEGAQLDASRAAQLAALRAAARLSERYDASGQSTEANHDVASDDELVRVLEQCWQEYQSLPVVRGGSATERITRRLLEGLELLKTPRPGVVVEPAVRDEAIDLAAALQDRVAQRLLRETVRQLQIELLKQRIRWRIEAASRPDFSAQQRDCELVDRALVRDGLVTAAWAEALVENGRQGPALDRLFDDHLPIDAAHEAYVDYVRLRVLGSNASLLGSPLFEQTLQRVVRALESKPMPWALSSPYRQRRAAAIALAVVKQQRNHFDSLVDAALMPPFRQPVAATNAYELLCTFDRLLTSSSGSAMSQVAGENKAPLGASQTPDAELAVAVRLNLMLAAWFQASPDTSLARQLSQQLARHFENPSDEGLRRALHDADRVLVLRVLAQSHAANASEAPDSVLPALAAYEKLVRQLIEQHPIREWDDDTAVRVMREIITPALSLETAIDHLAAEQQSQAIAACATLYGARGELLSEHLYADWGAVELATLRQQRFDAFDGAVRYAERVKQVRPEYLVGRGDARIKLSDRPSPKTLDLVEDDARAALKLEPASGPANSLLALVFRYRASQVASRDRDAVVQFMQRAERLCRQAVEAAEEPQTKAHYLTDLSNVYLWWANFATDTNLRQQRLEQAIDTARQALELAASEEDAHRAWGNAAEDLAWIVARERQDAAMADHFYEVALEQHKQATRIRPRKAIAWLDFGRAALRSATEHYHETPRVDPLPSIAEARQRLETARDALQEAARLDPSLDQAAYFLALVATALGDHRLAAREFARALQLAVDTGQREVSYSSQWARSTMAMLSETAFRLLDRHNNRNLPTTAEVARDAIKTLAALPPGVGVAWYSDPQKEVTALRSVVLALEGKSDEAREQLEPLITANGRPSSTNADGVGTGRSQSSVGERNSQPPSKSDRSDSLERAASQRQGSREEQGEKTGPPDEAETRDSAETAFADINLYVADALIALLDETGWNRKAAVRNRALSQAKRAYSLAHQDRGAITPTRRIVATEVCAMVLYQLAKRRDDPLRVRSASRAGAKHLLTLLIDDPLSLYHPHEWMWREQLADVLIDELLEGDVEAAARPTLVERIRQHLAVAAQLGADRAQIRSLREDLAKALEAQRKQQTKPAPQSR